MQSASPILKDPGGLLEKEKENILSIWNLLGVNAGTSWGPLRRAPVLQNTWAELRTEAYPLSSSPPPAGWSSLPPPPPFHWRTLPACSPYCLARSRGFKRTQTWTAVSKNSRTTVEHRFQPHIPRTRLARKVSSSRAAHGQQWGDTGEEAMWQDRACPLPAPWSWSGPFIPLNLSFFIWDVRILIHILLACSKDLGRSWLQSTQGRVWNPASSGLYWPPPLPIMLHTIVTANQKRRL